MSQLYIRLRTGFYAHVKTLRLKARLGADALWLVPRLWAFAADHQPDGDLSGYTAAELGALLGYEGEPCGMLVALTACGFVDADGRIHDWAEHNSYHEKFSAKAKLASAARWKKKRKTRKQDKDKDKEGSIPPSMPQGMLQASEALAWLNSKADKHFRATPDNLKTISLRLGEVNGDLDGVKAMIERQVLRWKGDAVMDEYLRVTTLFNKTKFHEYYDARANPVLAEAGGTAAGPSAVDTIKWQKELDRVQVGIDRIKGTYGGMQTWADEDRVEIKRLKALKVDLMARLGLQA